MIRTLALVGLAALAACSSGGSGPIANEVRRELAAALPGRPAPDAPDGAAARPLRRADIVAANVAAVWARLDSDPTPTLMYAVSENGGYVTYQSQFRQSVTLRGARITATRGIGTDLVSAGSSRPDPLAQAIPPAAWPARVRRSYEFPGEGPQGRIEAFDCTFEPGVPREAVILEIRYQGVEFSETCTGPTGTFENLHFADARTGFVWRSLQWIGPDMELVELQVLEPFGE